MTDEEFDAMWTGQDPGPESNGCIYVTLFVILFWGVVVLAAAAVIA